MAADTSSRTQSGRLTKWLVSGPPFLFLFVFFLIPSLIMVAASFMRPGEFGGLAGLFPLRGSDESGVTLENYAVFFGDWIYVQIFLKSFGVAALTTFICLVMAYPVALLIARSPKRYRDLMVLLCVLPFASNFLVRVYAWMIILGPFDLLFSRFAVIVGMVYVHLPFMILPLYTNLEKHDPTLLDAAQDLGAGPGEILRRRRSRQALLAGRGRGVPRRLIGFRIRRHTSRCTPRPRPARSRAG